MSPKKKISRNALIRNSKFESEAVVIEDKAKITDVYIKAKKITVKSNATLTGCKLFSNGEVIIGKNTIIKEQTIINAFKSISIGDRTIIDRDIMIGGMQSEKSEIKIGDDCVILYRSYLNTTRKISIGNNVGVGGYCLIFTHSAWQNVLDGNPYKFAEVKINDNAWLPWNVTVMPGITIEKEVTVGSGSIITKNLPPRVFAAGVPAKIIQKKELGNLSLKHKNTIFTEILSDFEGYARDFLKLKIFVTKNSSEKIISLKNLRLVFTSNFKKIQKNDVVISFKIPNQIKQKYQWIDLDSLSSNANDTLAKNFIVFIRRYGIKIKVTS